MSGFQGRRYYAIFHQTDEVPVSAIHSCSTEPRGALGPTMPWIKATLKGQTVFARVQADGSLQADGGRVEIRYRADDGRKYSATAANLAPLGGGVLPEETCGPAEAVERAQKAKRAAGGGSAKKGSKKSGPQTAPSTADCTAYAFTDGACSGNPGPAGLGVVLIANGRRLELSEYLGSATNNIAELTAILRALEELPAREAGEKIAIFTDSSYSIGVLSKGWKPKVNKELINDARQLLAKRPVDLRYVPGHAGVPLNERADELARAAIETRGNDRSES